MDFASNPLAEQLAYYRAVAGEYHEHAIDVPGIPELLAAIGSFQASGNVLELACGSGLWTERLAQTAASLTALDGAPEMLDLARSRVNNSAVRFIEADLFLWEPDKRYDVVYFGFWISHVPEERFEPFWSMVADALEPGGRVFFFDDNFRTPAELVEGAASPIVQRRLNDGTAYRVVKVPYRADDLEQRLRHLGWDITVTATPGPFYWGTGER
jgi:trans-aconitate methyltransferase